MATSVKVITAYCDLGLTKRPSADFHVLGRRLLDQLGVDGHKYEYSKNDAWTWDAYKNYPAANARAYDRFDDDLEHARSNLIQHTPVQWLEEAALDFPQTDVFVWMGYSILKQGDHTGKRILPYHVADFVYKLRNWAPTALPFPGMDPFHNPIEPFGDNWRFCGSMLVVPRQFVFRVGNSYRANFKSFVQQHKAIPLDLAIWPMVEFSSGLPWKQYPAEYDYTQLTNFPFTVG